MGRGQPASGKRPWWMAYVFLRRPSRSYTGRFVVDDEVLTEGGTTHLGPDRHAPSARCWHLSRSYCTAVTELQLCEECMTPTQSDGPAYDQPTVLLQARTLGAWGMLGKPVVAAVAMSQSSPRSLCISSNYRSGPLAFVPPPSTR